MNFCVEAQPLHHVRSYGKELANGSYDGFAGVLQRKEADIVATDFTVTHEVKLYTSSYLVSNLSIKLFSEEQSCGFLTSF